MDAGGLPPTESNHVSSDVEEAAPNVEEAAPNVEEAAPNIEEAAPNVEEAAPDVEEAAPNAEEVVPPDTRLLDTSDSDGSGGKSDESAPKGRKALSGPTTRLWNSVVHVPPMTIAGVLVYINLKRLFWFYESTVSKQSYMGPSVDTIKNLLQLAAKVHELLIAASLGAIILKLFQRRLVEKKLPFGLLTGAYRVGDVAYIFSGQFWGSLHSQTTLVPLLLGIFLLVTTIVLTLVGPASAILMVPELDWFPLSDAFSNIQGPIFYNRSPNDTWPRVLDGSARGVEYCDSEAGLVAYQCPAGGYSELWNWVSGWEISTLTNYPTFQEPVGGLRRQLILGGVFGEQYEDGLTTFTTTVSMPSMLTISRLLEYSRYKSVDLGSLSKASRYRLKTLDNTPIYQPLVQTGCSAYNREDFLAATKPVGAMYDTSFIECFGDPQCERLIAEKRYAQSDLWNSTSLSPRIALFGANESFEHPLFASASIPYWSGKEKEVKVWVFTCAIMAHWAPSVLTVSPSESALVVSNITDLADVFHRTDVESLPPMGPAINIKDSWVRFLNPELPVANLPNSTSLNSSSAAAKTYTPLGMLLGVLLAGAQNNTVSVFDPAGGYVGGVDFAKTVLQKLLGAMVADGLARVASDQGSFALVADDDTNMTFANFGKRPGLAAGDGTGNLSPGELNYSREEMHEAIRNKVIYEFDVERYGYGSGKEGPTMGFALAVMYIYFVIVGSYALYVACAMYFQRPRGLSTVVAWGDVQNMLLLAWNSKPEPNRQG
ncbi:hypothetical protein B0T25DRAFT_566048 [Lasiosphaeria hispida]|uniref:Uncharacterized protein n=1 Tax=Lasiosphaeria hispida TaxID=260671 RepID=A0AAJ0MFH2_9PEZI|nr:hypothetical protein B0T25DRAFT_566048 [Lasiosphaeria hispida]